MTDSPLIVFSCFRYVRQRARGCTHTRTHRKRDITERIYCSRISSSSVRCFSPSPQLEMKGCQGKQLAEFIFQRGGKNVVVLTGAGCSTESGIPDYRGPHGTYRRSDFVPLTFQNFMKDDNEKRRYWARSMLGFSTMSGASCNAAHTGLYTLYRGGVVSHILTQNVDGLHHLAAHGSKGDPTEEGLWKYISSPYPVTELHGNIHLVICMQCGHVLPRLLLQKQLRLLNHDLYEKHIKDQSLVRPDGDFSAPRPVVEAMRLVPCGRCGGQLKPHVVLFGENVPSGIVRKTMDIVKTASCLICLGTSLQVYSAYRYVLAAKEAGVPVAIVNCGKTRGDGQEALKVDTTSVASVIAKTVDIMGFS